MKRLLFLVLAFALTLSGCGDNADFFFIPSNRNSPEGSTATVAFEDLEIDGWYDYDYNDFVTDVSVFGIYSRGNLAQLEFTFEARARGSIYVHDLHLLIPASTFGSDGTYTIELYETDGTLLSFTAASFTGNTDVDLVIFDNTWDALPPNPGQDSKGNTIDGCGVQPGRVTKISIDFDTPFAFDLGDYSPEGVGVHGDSLFVDPYLYVRDTDEEIHITDQRLVVVPTDWEWPEDHAAIWTVYPYNSSSGEGVLAGDPPSFTTYWYAEPPTDKKWTP